MLSDTRFSSLRTIRGKLTLSYTGVTVGSLLIVVLILGYLLLSRVFLPVDLFQRELTPQDWIRLIREDSAPLWQEALSQNPIDTGLISAMLQEADLQITVYDLLQIGDFQLQMRTNARGDVLIVNPEGILLGATHPTSVPEQIIGQPLDPKILPGLEFALKFALEGETDPDRLFVTLSPHERFYFAVPIMDLSGKEVLGAVLIIIQRLPTADDIPPTLLSLLGRSLLIFLLASGAVGTIFGALTARGMVARLERVADVTSAWSRGDFTRFIEDRTGDEVSRLADRLNHMAEQLQQFLKRHQEVAVSEERNRLARDLHDSAKQQALAASFHLGTALTLFERDPESARNHLHEADNLVDAVRRELTDLIHELRPPMMNGARFDESLNEYMIEWSHQTGIEAVLRADYRIDIPTEIKQAVLRILQEALSNVARHSDADRVAVTLNTRDRSVEFCVTDDGIGFDVHQQREGIGLDTMRERVESLQGQFGIESQPGQGTSICIDLPLE